ncbi:glycosyl transferase [Alkalilimnicola ehrlichii]|uniref:Glycosyl transferase n=1 Tax=Alkalilimnicola ehrlichii TaxID=351052 RepID=A0A3E0WZ48_9GAMM|nr:glycosyltransferase family 9 protein [Alkalilimnicola ehrlichii]RFA30113.1 glycosyl transferase [Alkalilimnicola ehrlichii]RFA37461.1 glycosyl transferase [Alkalilimnicola ehrlichii]
MSLHRKLSLATLPKRLCILRLSAIGDTCHVVPLVRTLQAHWPETAITWVIGRVEASLLSDIPGVEFITFDKRNGWKGYTELRSRLAGRRFDVLLNLQAALRASVLSRLISADIRLGYDKSRAKDFQWLFTNARIVSNPRVHQQETMFAFLEALGLHERVLSWNIPIPSDAEAFVRERIGGGRVLVISPCSSERRNNFRNWPAESYATIADEAARRYGMQTVLTGGGSELEQWYGEEISRLMTAKPLNLIGGTSLKQLLAVLQRADVLISPDSGPAHMANTVGTPVIGLYASSNPFRTGPYLSLKWTVNRYPDAVREAFGKTVEEIAWGKRVRDPSVMERIKVNDVMQNLDALAEAGFPRLLIGR